MSSLQLLLLLPISNVELVLTVLPLVPHGTHIDIYSCMKMLDTLFVNLVSTLIALLYVHYLCRDEVSLFFTSHVGLYIGGCIMEV